MKLILNVKTFYDERTLNAGDEIEVNEKIAKRWINNGIAHPADGNFNYEAKKYTEPVNWWGFNNLFDHHSLKDYIRHDRVSIVIPVYNALDYLKKCIDSLVKFTQNYELIIIDNNSNEETKQYLNELKVTLGFKLQTNKENKGFSYACNQGIKLSGCNYICFLNSDTVLTPNWLGKMMRGFKLENAGILGASTCYIAGKQCLTGLRDKRFNMSLEEIIDVSLDLKEDYEETEVYGFCYLVKKEVIDKIGAFDYKTFGLGCGEENDFNRRARIAGFKTYWVKGAYVHHYGSMTFNEAKIDLNRQLKKNYPKLKANEKNETFFVENDTIIDEVKKTDVIIPVLDRKDETIKTLDSLFENNTDIHVIIVDNGSDDLDYLKNYNVEIIKNNTNLGVIKALNQGLALANSKYVVVMHNDVVVDTPNWIGNCIAFMEANADVGMVGLAGWTKLNNRFYDGRIITSIENYKKKPRGFEEVVVLDGCCNVLRNIGLRYDDRYGLTHGYDYDMSMQYHVQGYKLYVFEASARHLPEDGIPQTTKNPKYVIQDDNKYRIERQKIFFDKWKMFLPIEVGKEQKIKLDLGCGFRKKDGFIGIDRFDYSGRYDDFICGEIPEVLSKFKDNSISEVHASHFIEHIPQNKVITFMNEVYRILKIGGTFEIFVPPTTGRGAFCDPTHVSFWNDLSFRYYDKTWEKDLTDSYGIKADFETIKMEHLGEVSLHVILRKR